MPTVAAKKQPAVGGDREASQWMPPAAYLAEQGSTGSLPQAPKVPPPSEAPPPPTESPPPPPEGPSSSSVSGATGGTEVASAFAVPTPALESRAPAAPTSSGSTAAPP